MRPAPPGVPSRCLEWREGVAPQSAGGEQPLLTVALVAIERPDGLLIGRLLDAGLVVVAIHPNQVAAMRPRFGNAGGKSDSFDAFVLAEPAWTDSHRFRILLSSARPHRRQRLPLAVR